MELLLASAIGAKVSCDIKHAIAGAGAGADNRRAAGYITVIALRLAVEMD